MSAATKGAVPAEAGIEESLARIEELVAGMESGKLPLEDMITRFEEGARLVKACREKLDAAEKRVQIIVRETSGGEASLDDFDTAG
jgi:exodeoxyribonuclease VII small subunit